MQLLLGRLVMLSAAFSSSIPYEVQNPLDGSVCLVYYRAACSSGGRCVTKATDFEHGNPAWQAGIASEDDIQVLLGKLVEKGYEISGPTVRDQAVIYDHVTAVDQLPVGFIEEQDGGRYRLVRSGDKRLFGHTVGPQSWKKYLYPAVRKVLTAKGGFRQFEVGSEEYPLRKIALIGLRSCDLAAMSVVDRVLLKGPYVDSFYERVRNELLIIAVNCTRAGDTCFCGSMGTGPRATSGYDMALTEIVSGDRHHFLVESGSARGSDLLNALKLRLPSAEQMDQASRAVMEAASSMGRSMDTGNLKEVMDSSFDDVHWDDVARRCLTCGNCTMVCPTCFCTNIEDTTDLAGTVAQRTRYWDSCYTLGFSYIHGGSIRPSEKSRYRQWIMHKLSYWQEQFGVLGCIGCGRCITWCPVGIDITAEVRNIRDKIAR